MKELLKSNQTEYELLLELRDFNNICNENLLKTMSKEVYDDIINFLKEFKIFLEEKEFNKLSDPVEISIDDMIIFFNSITNLPKSITSLNLNFFEDHVKDIFNTKGMVSFFIFEIKKEKGMLDFSKFKLFNYIHYIKNNKYLVYDSIMEDFIVTEMNLFKLIKTKSDYIYFRDNHPELIKRIVENYFFQIISESTYHIYEGEHLKDYNFILDAVKDSKKDSLMPSVQSIILLLKKIELNGLTNNLKHLLLLLNKTFIKNQFENIKIDLNLGLGGYKTITRLKKIIKEEFDFEPLFFSSIDVLQYNDFNKVSRLFLSSMTIDSSSLYKLINFIEENELYEIKDGQLDLNQDTRILLLLNYKY